MLNSAKNSWHALSASTRNIGVWLYNNRNWWVVKYAIPASFVFIAMYGWIRCYLIKTRVQSIWNQIHKDMTTVSGLESATELANPDISFYLNFGVIATKYQTEDGLQSFDRMAGSIKSSIETLVSKGYPIEYIQVPYLKDLYLYTKAKRATTSKELDVVTLLQCLMNMENTRVIIKFVQEHYKDFENDQLYEPQYRANINFVLKGLASTYRKSKSGQTICELGNGIRVLKKNTEMDKFFFRILLITFFKQKPLQSLGHGELMKFLVDIRDYEIGELFELTAEEALMIFLNQSHPQDCGRLIQFFETGELPEPTPEELEFIQSYKTSATLLKKEFEAVIREGLFENLFEPLDSGIYQDLLEVFKREGNDSISPKFCELLLACIREGNFDQEITNNLLFKCNLRELREVIMPSLSQGKLTESAGLILYIADRENNLEFAEEVISRFKSEGCMDGLSKLPDCVWYVNSLLLSQNSYGKSIVFKLFREMSEEQVSAVVTMLYRMLEIKQQIKNVYKSLCTMINEQNTYYTAKEVLRKLIKSAKELYLEEELENSYDKLMRSSKLGIAKLAIDIALEEGFALEVLCKNAGNAGKLNQVLMIIRLRAYPQPQITLPEQELVSDITFMAESCLPLLLKLEALIDSIRIRSKLSIVCKKIMTSLMSVCADAVYFNFSDLCEHTNSQETVTAWVILINFLSGSFQPFEINKDLACTNFDILTYITMNGSPIVKGELIEIDFIKMLAHKYPRLCEYKNKGHQEVSLSGL
jgi:hypothetical protein